MNPSSTVPSTSAPISIDDPVNAAILAVSEDTIQGFEIDPFLVIANKSGVDVDTVVERIRAMLRSGTIRRVRQTLLATNLAQGALVAWKVPEDKLDAAFDFLFERDPFSGHVVIRSTDAVTPGSDYRLWTTLKVPRGFSIDKHAEFLKLRTGATAYRLMPALRAFALGVGHMRRRGIDPGSKADIPADDIEIETVELSELDWRVLIPLKREFAAHEICRDIWRARADEAGVGLEEFRRVAESLARCRLIGRFSTFLEHQKPVGDQKQVSQFNGLFHWAVPPGREIEAGREIGRFHAMTHAYWRQSGPEFANVNIMGVAHSASKGRVEAVKAAIDRHLDAQGIPLLYSNVFWSDRSEIKPSEIAPSEYLNFCAANGIDSESMRG